MFSLTGNRVGDLEGQLSQMQKGGLIKRPCLSLLLFGVLLYAGLASMSATMAAGGLTWQMVKIKEEKKKPMYTIDVSYPKFSAQPAQAVPVDSLNKTISGMVLKMVSDSKKDFARAKAFSKDVGSDLSAEPNIVLATPDVVSLDLSYSVFVAGTAHPNQVTQVLNYQMNPPARLTLDRIFKPDSGYLQKLSSICSQQLKSALGADADMQMIKSGTKPTAENFKNFCFHKDALEILFCAYQVAPYVAGPQSVSIPWKKIKPLLATDSVAFKLADGK
jgi:hypothetical protein